MIRRTIIQISLLLGLLLQAGCFSPSATFKETRTINIEHIPEKGMKVHSVNGALSAESSDRSDVEVIVRIKATSAERLAAVEIIAERDKEQTLNIYAKWPKKRKNNEGCSFEIKIPDATNVDLHTSNGKVSCSGLSGQGVFSTSNGQININTHEGAAKISTSNGAIEAQHLSGELHASTSNGRINAMNIGGPTHLRTSNGQITAINVISPIHAKTSNGAITLELGKMFEGDMNASTARGALNISGFDHAKIISSGKNNMHFSVDDSGQNSSATTSNGSITIKPY